MTDPQAMLKKVPRRFVEDFPLAELEDYPGNPKDHDIGAILESMQTNGIVDPLFVQDWPDTPWYIIGGHGRKKTLEAAGITHVDCLIFEISPKAARRYVLAANRAAERGGWNQAALVDFLNAHVTGEDMFGTGFDLDDAEANYKAVMGLSHLAAPEQPERVPDVEQPEDDRGVITVEVEDRHQTDEVRAGLGRYFSTHPQWSVKIR